MARAREARLCRLILASVECVPEAGAEAETVEESPEEASERDLGVEEGGEDAFAVGGVVADSAEGVSERVEEEEDSE